MAAILPPQDGARWRHPLGYLYVGSGLKGLSVVDITNPAAPGLVASLTTVNVGDLAMQGTLGFAVSMSEGLKIIDLSVPTEPKLVGEVAGATGYGVEAEGTTVVTSGGYLSPKYTGLSVVDVATPTAPKLLAQMSNVWGSDVIVRGKAIYLGRSYSASAYNDESRCKTAACTIDLTQPSAPAFVASVDSRVGADGMFLAAGRLHVARRGDFVRYNLDAPLAPIQHDSTTHAMGRGIGWGCGDADERGVVMVEAAGYTTAVVYGWIDFLQEDATGKLTVVDRISELNCTEVRLARPYLYAVCNLGSSGQGVRIFDISAL